MSGDFTPEQKRYLEGFASGLQAGRAAAGVPRGPAPAAEPTGPDGVAQGGLQAYADAVAGQVQVQVESADGGRPGVRDPGFGGGIGPCF